MDERTDGHREVEKPFRPRGWAALRGRLFHIFFVLSRPMTLGVRCVIHDEETQSVFLIRHTYVPGWQLPGGGVEKGETAIDALRREVREEAEIELAGAPELKSFHFNRNASPRDHVALYLATRWRSLGPKRPDREIAAAGFFRLDALPEGTTPATRRRLGELFQGREVSPYW